MDLQKNAANIVDKKKYLRNHWSVQKILHVLLTNFAVLWTPHQTQGDKLENTIFQGKVEVRQQRGR